MDFKNKRVLILDGAARQLLPLAKGFYDLGCIVTTLCSSKLDVGYTTRYKHHAIADPKIAHDDVYYGQLIEQLSRSGEYDLLVPLTDRSTDLITKNEEVIDKYIKKTCPSKEVYNRAFDKQYTMETCERIGVPCPITHKKGTSVEEFVDKIGFPIVVKPRNGWGSIGFRVLHDKESLFAHLDSMENGVERSIIQEYIPQTKMQYACLFFGDSNGKVCSGVISEKRRQYPVDGGAAVICYTVDRPDILAQGIRLLEEIEWSGACSIDMIEDPRDGKVKVMEINARIPASQKLTFINGINTSLQMLERAFDTEVTKYSVTEFGKILRCINTDVLWFFKSKNRFKADPNWFSFKNTVDQIFSIRDIRPFFSYGIQCLNLKRLIRETKKRKH